MTLAEIIFLSKNQIKSGPMSVWWSEDEHKHQVSLTSESRSDTSRLGPPPDLLAWGLSCWSSSLSQLRCRFLCKSEMERTESFVSGEDSRENIKVKECDEKDAGSGGGGGGGGDGTHWVEKERDHEEEPKIAPHTQAVTWSDMWHSHYEITLINIPSLGSIQTLNRRCTCYVVVMILCNVI